MGARYENDHLQKDVCRSLYHAAATANTTKHIFKARAECVVTRIEYANETGLVADAANHFRGEVKKGATLVSTLFNTNSAGGAALGVTVLTPALSAVAGALVLAAGDVLDLVLTETGLATLPPGDVHVYVTEL